MEYAEKHEIPSSVNFRETLAGDPSGEGCRETAGISPENVAKARHHVLHLQPATAMLLQQ